MKLKRQREDVRLMRDWAGHPKPISQVDTDLLAIAGRYKRMILFAEEADRLYYRGIYTARAKRVIKDAEAGK